MANPHVPGLTDSGWQSAGSCMCQGSLKYKYAKRFPKGLAIIKVPASGVPRWVVEWFDHAWSFNKSQLNEVIQKLNDGKESLR